MKISSEQVIILKDKIKHLQEELDEIIKNCQHDFQILKEEFISSDEYGFYGVLYRTSYCKICGTKEYKAV